MNVYDEAHSLARAISESEEFKQYDEAKKVIAAKPEIDAMIKDFQAKQMQFQAKQMMGEELPQNYMQELSGLSAVLMQDPTAADYMAKEMRFAMMMQDVYGILNEVVGFAPGTGGSNE